MEKFIEYIVKNLVDAPDAVDVQAFDGEGSVRFEIRVAKADIGKVVGRRGQTIKALRLISSLTAQRVGMRVRIDVMDSEDDEEPAETVEADVEKAADTTEVAETVQAAESLEETAPENNEENETLTVDEEIEEQVDTAEEVVSETVN